MTELLQYISLELHTLSVPGLVILPDLEFYRQGDDGDSDGGGGGGGDVGTGGRCHRDISLSQRRTKAVEVRQIFRTCDSRL